MTGVRTTLTRLLKTSYQGSDRNSTTSYQGSDRNSTVDYADADSLNGTLDTAVGNDHAKQALKTAGSGGSAHDALGYLYDNSTRHLGTGTQTNFCVQ
ncbi:hypothetical protein GQ54DRAFT_307544 [Martensiomyces pterosporus]|nr:hypothetical protein GQ54DRAFT_307544 [Martensiomyces pterosporus]